ncbi:hypothetical protein PPIS_a4116 [Pseudoalteromonas piscicida]|uniref:Uncharacterized protein n=1 Tax=Pseudoalteromonas piscicida TaxID=43662 RepID=A0ABN5CKR7_PSEO7|nr:hypothetical protein PPIS_a4116 [Pseudoalteromonas piscicida]MBE0371419.1 hypothetical protein [Pseudoalteromonas flavipulchra NCIMB 2033 = ATCC BAA-314]
MLFVCLYCSLNQVAFLYLNRKRESIVENFFFKSSPSKNEHFVAFN